MLNQSGPQELEMFIASIHRRHMAMPLLLFCASHHPLTFITGQLLFALAPLCALLGWGNASEWAEFLSAPDANQRLRALFTAPAQPTSQGR
jgi:hypothetical protein